MLPTAGFVCSWTGSGNKRLGFKKPFPILPAVLDGLGGNEEAVVLGLALGAAEAEVTGREPPTTGRFPFLNSGDTCLLSHRD